MHRTLRALLRFLIVAVVVQVPAVARADDLAIPAQVQVPDDQVLVFKAFADGTQNYACQTADSGAGKWVFRQPMAVLSADDGTSIGIHGRGPFWASYDGSRVIGSAPISAPSAEPASDIPLLLLRGASPDTEGQFSGVTYIQRL